jgi:large subunit ribosomal protein L1
VGRASFDQKLLVENYASLLDEILRAKPSSSKGKYVKSITIASTMGPGIKVDPSVTRNLLEA